MTLHDRHHRLMKFQQALREIFADVRLRARIDNAMESNCCAATFMDFRKPYSAYQCIVELTYQCATRWYSDGPWNIIDADADESWNSSTMQRDHMVSTEFCLQPLRSNIILFLYLVQYPFEISISNGYFCVLTTNCHPSPRRKRVAIVHSVIAFS